MQLLVQKNEKIKLPVNNIQSNQIRLQIKQENLEWLKVVKQTVD